MKPPDNTGGYNMRRRRSRNNPSRASMKPPDNTGGYWASKPALKRHRFASMKPPDNTGGYLRSALTAATWDSVPQ